MIWEEVWTNAKCAKDNILYVFVEGPDASTCQALFNTDKEMLSTKLVGQFYTHTNFEDAVRYACNASLQLQKIYGKQKFTVDELIALPEVRVIPYKETKAEIKRKTVKIAGDRVVSLDL